MPHSQEGNLGFLTHIKRGQSMATSGLKRLSAGMPLPDFLHGCGHSGRSSRIDKRLEAIWEEH